MSSPEPDLGALLREALSMQGRLADARSAAAVEEVEGRAGGGAVKVRVTGDMEFRSVSIDPAAVDPSDLALLEDLLLAALHDAVAQVAAVNETNLASAGLAGAGLGDVDLAGLMGQLGLGVGEEDPAGDEPPRTGPAGHPGDR